MITIRTAQSLIKALFARRHVRFMHSETKLDRDAVVFVGQRGLRGLEGLIDPDRCADVRVVVTGMDLAQHSDRRRLKKVLRGRVDDACYAVFP